MPFSTVLSPDSGCGGAAAGAGVESEVDSDGGGSLPDAGVDSGCCVALSGAAVVVGGASSANILPGGCWEFCAAEAGFFWMEIGPLRGGIPGGRISIGGFFPASAKLVSLGSSREAKNAAAASVFCDGVGSTSLCSAWFQI